MISRRFKLTYFVCNNNKSSVVSGPCFTIVLQDHFLFKLIDISILD